MSTVTVWLLLSVGFRVGYPAPTVLIERFLSRVQCEQTKAAVESAYRGTGLLCVEATVIR